MADMPANPYRRILLKLSGEALSGETGFGVDSAELNRISGEIAEVAKLGTEIAIVIGGGNFFRGVNAKATGMARVTADYMGMLATVMNALALQQALVNNDLETRVQSALAITPVAEPYVRGRALKHLDVGRIVVFAAGTGNPLFTTDTAASLRAVEIGADLMIKATKVDGVFSDDPVTNPDARRYRKLSYDQVLVNELRVMDAAAVAMCKEHQLPIRVISIRNPGALFKTVSGADIGTIVS